MKKYYPVLLSKKGEIIALQYLAQDVKDEISPIIEVLQEAIEKRVEENNSVKIIHRDEFEKFLKTHWCFFNNQIILDFSLIPNLENKISQVEKLLVSLIKAGVNVIPTIQKNSTPSYIQMAKNLIREYRLNCCFRTSEKSGGFDFFKPDVEKFVSDIEIDFSRIVLLLDLGIASNNNINMLGTITKTSLISLVQKITDWLSVVIASSSFPEDLSEFKQPNKTYRIDRHEWTVWNNLKNDDLFKDIKYGDFGTKYPFYQEISHAGTVSLKYTLEKEFLIYRGLKSKDHPDGNRQYIKEAWDLIMSRDYYKNTFSWGDAKIHSIANQDLKTGKPGNHTTWVQISQNHHITLLHSLL